MVLYYDEGREERQCTVVTSQRGVTRGKRIVRGREAETEQYYQTTQPADAAAAATLATATPETLDELARLLTATAAAVTRATPVASRTPEAWPW